MSDSLPVITALPGADAPAAGDVVSARQWLLRCVGNDAAMGELRRSAQALADGTDWSRAGDHEVVDRLADALAAGWARAGSAAPPALLKLVPAAAPAPAPPPPPASAPRAAPAASPPPAAETTFGNDLDVAAMVAVLQQAAQDGVPFCEECAKAAAEAAA